MDKREKEIEKIASMTILQEYIPEYAEIIAKVLVESGIRSKEGFEITVWRGKKPYCGHEHSIHNHKFSVQPVDYSMEEDNEEIRRDIERI